MPEDLLIRVYLMVWALLAVGNGLLFWGKSAENVGNVLGKGRLVYVEGRLKTRSREDDAGTKHYRTEVVAESWQALNRPSDEGEAAA